MKILLPILLLLFSCATSDAKRKKSEKQTTVWQGDFASAVAFAKKHNKFILIDRKGSEKDTSSYCKSRIWVKKHIYTSKEWKTYADQVLVVYIRPHYPEVDSTFPFSFFDTPFDYVIITPDSLNVVLRFSLANDSLEALTSSKILPKDFVITIKRGLYTTDRVRSWATENLDKLSIREWHRYMDTLELIKDSMQFVKSEYNTYWNSVKMDFSKNLKMLEARSYWRTLESKEDSVYTKQFLAPYVGEYAAEGEMLRMAIKEYHAVSVETNKRKTEMVERLKVLEQKKNRLLDELMYVDDMID